MHYYATYIEVPGISGQTDGVFKRKLYYFSDTGINPSSKLSGVDQLKLAPSVSVISGSLVQLTGQIIPEIKIVTGYLAGEKNFVSRYIFSLKKVTVDHSYPLNMTTQNDNSPTFRLYRSNTFSTDRQEANRLAVRNLLTVTRLVGASVSSIYDVKVESYWRDLFLSDG